MRRFYIEEIKAHDKTCVITGSEARHISKVLRMKPGERIILTDKKGVRFQAAIESLSVRQVLVRLERPIGALLLSDLRFTLCQAVTKSQAMDYVIQKTSELGVNRIMPFFSERTVVTLDKDRVVNKMAHWKAVAESSAKQCGRAVPVSIELPMDFWDLLEKWHDMDVPKAILWEKEESKDLKMLLRNCGPEKDFVSIIGPEGGFTIDEVDAARNAGFIPVSLGPRVLRAETAAVAITVIVQYELGDLGLKSSYL